MYTVLRPLSVNNLIHAISWWYCDQSDWLKFYVDFGSLDFASSGRPPNIILMGLFSLHSFS